METQGAFIVFVTFTPNLWDVSLRPYGFTGYGWRLSLLWLIWLFAWFDICLYRYLNLAGTNIDGATFRPSEV